MSLKWEEAGHDMVGVTKMTGNGVKLTPKCTEYFDRARSICCQGLWTIAEGQVLSR